jgi:predicted metal-dependent hydrolase
MSATPANQLSLFDAERRDQPFAVRVSRRARRLSVRVYAGGRVEVIVPAGVGAKSVRDFVGKFAPWIDRKVAELRPALALSEIGQEVPTQIDLPAVGETFSVEWRQGECAGLRMFEDRLLLSARDADAGRRLLQHWVQNQARARLEPWLRQVALELDAGITRVSIRRQRTRWGSCSSRGSISLNCCLMFQRPEVVKYLFTHEIAHLRHMNHSPRFWRLVESLEPDFRKLDRELLAGWNRVPGWMFSP